ncbi:MAG: hypothetical protein QNJ16_05195 [Rhodobacter sp.]|nr:hypothetical protein [Rhodobacter sp.]
MVLWKAIGLTAALGAGVAVPASGLTLTDCDRTTHISHGGETGHRDLGAGRVAYAEWWSQEGVYLDIVVADCGTGEKLMARTREERISERPPFDRTDKAVRILDQQLSVSPSLFSLTRLAGALQGTGKDIEIAAMAAEPCACAALYPGLQVDRAPFGGLE